MPSSATRHEADTQTSRTTAHACTLRRHDRVVAKVWGTSAAGKRQTPTRAVASLAGTRWGVVGRHQLTELGIAPRTIDGWLASGRLHRLHRGVYAVGHPHVPLEGRWLAAVLTCSPGAVLSRYDATQLWGLARYANARIDVTVTRDVRSRPGLRVHRTRSLPEEDVEERLGIAVTSVARTLLDMAAVVGPEALCRLVDRAEALRLFDLRAVDAVLARAAGRRGATALRAVVAVERPLTRSELEERFAALAARWQLPTPLTNVLRCGYEVDVLWPDRGVVVELDGFETHGTRRAFERDRLRDAALTAAGFRVLRVTWRRLRDDPAGVRADLEALVGPPPPALAALPTA